MKFSDIHETLTEAPEKFDAKQGLLKTAKNKIKKNLAPTKKGREQAQVEDDTKQAAKQIKSQYNKWMAQTGDAGAKASTASFIEFAKENAPELVRHIAAVATKLNLAAPPAPVEKPEDIQKQVSTDGVNYSVELDKTGAPKKDAAPEKAKEPTDPSKKPEGMEQEEYDSIKAAYAKNAETDESVEEDSDDAEPKVDMSASIYEARLNSFLLFEREMKDNELDTLIVRVLQAAAKGGDSVSAPASTQQQQQSLPQRPGTEEQPEKKDGWRQKFSKAMTGTGNVGDLVSGDGSDGSSGGSETPNLGTQDIQALSSLLSTVAKGKAGPKEKKIANKLLQTIQNTYGE